MMRRDSAALHFTNVRQGAARCGSAVSNQMRYSTPRTPAPHYRVRVVRCAHGRLSSGEGCPATRCGRRASTRLQPIIGCNASSVQPYFPGASQPYFSAVFPRCIAAGQRGADRVGLGRRWAGPHLVPDKARFFRRGAAPRGTRTPIRFAPQKISHGKAKLGKHL